MPDQPVIITGGSVKIEFNATEYLPETSGTGKFRNTNLTVERIDIRDDNTGQTQTIQAPANGKCTITIHTK
ncbi:MAG TPA: hypothetical protein VGB73_09680 [Pyrinomonadaceae bacterium]|jgi:hypothetical protein